jgi:hypothetical protein
MFITHIKQNRPEAIFIEEQARLWILELAGGRLKAME